MIPCYDLLFILLTQWNGAALHAQELQWIVNNSVAPVSACQQGWMLQPTYFCFLLEISYSSCYKLYKKIIFCFVRYLLQKILRWIALSPRLPRMICGPKLLEMSICNMLSKKSSTAFAIFWPIYLKMMGGNGNFFYLHPSNCFFCMCCFFIFPISAFFDAI